MQKAKCKIKNVIFLGPPGAGKGTQALFVSRELTLPHIAMSDLLRQRINENSFLSEKINEYVRKGELVPDNLVTEILKFRLDRLDCKNGFILDGFPRTINQAGALDKYLGTGRSIWRVINFIIPEEVIINRLSGRLVCRACSANYHITNMPPQKAEICDHCGGKLSVREDDREETVKRRLQVYEKETSPVIKYYKDKDILVDFPGDLPLEQAHHKLLDLLNKNG